MLLLQADKHPGRQARRGKKSVPSSSSFFPWSIGIVGPSGKAVAVCRVYRRKCRYNLSVGSLLP